ncbi:hypothetical protein [Streptomyces sp. NPDC046976]
MDDTLDLLEVLIAAPPPADAARENTKEKLPRVERASAKRSR